MTLRKLGKTLPGRRRWVSLASAGSTILQAFGRQHCLGADLFDQVRGSGATEVACDSETCRWQITHATGHKSVHPIDYLHRAYGL